MNKVALILAAILVVSVTAFGQAGTWSAGFSAAGALPIGDLSNTSKLGIGGTAWGAYNVDPNLSIMVKSGYLRFSGKDISTTINIPGYGDTTLTGTAGSVGAVPILVCGRYFFMPPGDTRVYGSADVGMYMLSFEGGGSSTKFGFSPTLGAQFKAGEKMNVDIYGNYTYVATDITAATWIGFGIGLEFMLQ
jgi:opacity protein-like surface antigen